MANWPRYVCGFALGISIIFGITFLIFLSCILMRRGEIISPLLYTQRISTHQKMPENELVIEGNVEVILEGIQVAHCNTFDIPLVPDMCCSDLTNAVVSESFHVPVTCINSAAHLFTICS